jgi:hypothetical protein
MKQTVLHPKSPGGMPTRSLLPNKPAPNCT